MKHITAKGVLTVLLTAAAALPSLATDYTWKNAAGGDWGEASNWTPNGFPVTPTDHVFISQNITNDQTIVVDITDAAAGWLDLTDGDGSHGWLIEGTNPIHLANTGGLHYPGTTPTDDPYIVSTGGVHTIGVPLVVTDGINLRVVMFNDTVLTITSAVSRTVGTCQLMKTGDSTLVLKNEVDLTALWVRNGTVTFDPGSSFTTTVETAINGAGNETAFCTLNLNSGTASAPLRFGASVLCGNSVANSSGDLNVLGGYSSIHNLFVGQQDSGKVNELNVSGGILETTFRLWVGNAGDGRMTVTGGRVVCSAGEFKLAHSGDGSLWLNGGELNVPKVLSGSGGSLLLFNGGTLSPTASSASFLEGLTEARVQAGGAVVSNAFDITIAQPLIADPVFANGGLVKKGSAALTLTGANTYTGDSVIEDGTLVMSTRHGGGGGIVVTNGTALAVVRDVSAEAVLSCGKLTLDSGMSATQSLTFVVEGQLATVNVTATNGFTANGTTEIEIAGYLPVGVYPLIDYEGAIQGQGFAGLTLADLPSFITAASLSNNTANTSVDLHVTGVDERVWTGLTDDQWNMSTTNWQGTGGGVAFVDGAVVRLDDTAAANHDIDIATNVRPAWTTVDCSAQSYSLSGSGGIGGFGGLVKSGSGSLIIGTVNEYAGSTLINGGTVSINSLANVGQPSALGSGGALVMDGSVLEYTGGNVATDRGATLGAGGGTIAVAASDATLTVGGVLVGEGMLTKTGAGTLGLANDNSYTGGTAVAAGTLVIGNGATAGSVLRGITNEGTVVFSRSDNVIFTETISGTGSVAQNGSGTLALADPQTYTGLTTVTSGTLVGTTAFAGPLAVDAGGTLSPADSGIGTMTLAGNLTLGGMAAMNIAKLGATLTGDKVVSAGAATVGGMLIVSASGDELEEGDSFDLFDAASFSGAFGSIDLPILPFSLKWDAGRLSVDGTLSVVKDTSVLASSVADWQGVSVQPHGQWEYGYYATPADWTSFTLVSVYSTYGVNVGGDGGIWTITASDYPRHSQYCSAPGWESGGDQRSVRRWTSDYEGEIHLNYDAQRLQSAGNGQDMRIRHNGTLIFDQYLQNGAPRHHAGTIDLTVAHGDKIDLVIDAHGTQHSDWTHQMASIDILSRTNLEGLVAHWPFDEENRMPVGWNYSRRHRAADHSGTNNHARLANFVSDGTEVHWASGRIGNGLEFDGGNDYVVTEVSNIATGATELTLACWIKPDGKDSWDGLITTKSTSANLFTGIALADYHPVNNTLSPTARIMNLQNFTCDVDTPVGVWSHVVLVWKSAQTWRFYINGELATDNDVNAPDTTIVMTQPWYIGTDRLIGGRYFDGLMDDVGIWTRALSLEEVAALYDNGVAGYDLQHAAVPQPPPAKGFLLIVK